MLPDLDDDEDRDEDEDRELELPWEPEDRYDPEEEPEDLDGAL